MNEYGFSITSEISEISDLSESDIPSLNSFFIGGNYKRDDDIVYKNKSNQLFYWLPWSLLLLSTFLIFASEYIDSGIFRSLFRYFQNTSKTDSTVNKDTNI